VNVSVRPTPVASVTDAPSPVWTTLKPGPSSSTVVTATFSSATPS
jgi:hypothetical protein